MSKTKSSSPKKAEAKTALLSLLLELEDNVGLFAGAEESLTGLGHKRRTIKHALDSGLIEIWRMCEDTTYYQLTRDGKCRVAFEHWGPIEARSLKEFTQSLKAGR